MNLVRLTWCIWFLWLSFYRVEALDLSKNIINKCENINSDSQIMSINDFTLQIDEKTNKLSINATLEAKEEVTSAKASLSLFLFGQKVFSFQLDLCTSIFSKSICPIEPRKFSVPYSVDLPSSVASIPETLAKIPGSNLSVQMKLTDAQGSEIGCASIGLSKPISIQQNALIGTSVGVAGLSSTLAVISGIAGASMIAALPAGMAYQIRPGPSPSLLDVVSTFQFISTSGMLGVKYADLYQDFTTNMGWSMGMINIPAFQQVAENMRPTAQKALVRRQLDSLLPSKNATTYSELAGVRNYANKLNVKPENYFITVLIIFCCIMGGVTVIILLLRLILEGLAIYKPALFLDLRNHYANYYVGNLLRVFILAYFILATAALFQLTLKDVVSITALAGVILGFFCILLMAIVTFLIVKAGPKRLYSEPKLNYKYGALYGDYRQSSYLFFTVVLLTSFIRAAAVGLLGNYVWAQLGVLVGVELLFLVAMFFLKPYATKVGNTLTVFIGVLRIANTGLLFLFIESIFLPDLARTIIAVVMIVLQGIMLLGLTLMTLWGLIVTITKMVKGEKLGPSTHNNSSEIGGTNDFRTQHSNLESIPLSGKRTSVLTSDFLDAPEVSEPLLPSFFRKERQTDRPETSSS